MKNLFLGIALGLSISVASAGWLSSGLGGAAGAAIATAGIEGKVNAINARIDALIRALDSVKVCK